MLILAMVLAAMLTSPYLVREVFEGLTEMRGGDSGRAQRRHAERMQKMQHAHEKWRTRTNERIARRDRGEPNISDAIQRRLADWIAGTTIQLDDTDHANGKPGFFKGAWRRARQAAHGTVRGWAERAEERLQQRFERKNPNMATPGPQYATPEPEGDDLRVNATDHTGGRDSTLPPNHGGGPKVSPPPGAVHTENSADRDEPKDDEDDEREVIVVDGEIVRDEDKPKSQGEIQNTPQVSLPAGNQEVDQGTEPNTNEDSDSDASTPADNVIPLFKEGENMTEGNALSVSSGQIVNPETGKNFSEEIAAVLSEMASRVQTAMAMMNQKGISENRIATVTSGLQYLHAAKNEFETSAEDFAKDAGARDHVKAAGAGTHGGYLD